MKYVLLQGECGSDSEDSCKESASFQLLGIYSSVSLAKIAGGILGTVLVDKTGSYSEASYLLIREVDDSYTAEEYPDWDSYEGRGMPDNDLVTGCYQVGLWEEINVSRRPQSDCV